MPLSEKENELLNTCTLQQIANHNLSAKLKKKEKERKKHRNFLLLMLAILALGILAPEIEQGLNRLIGEKRFCS